MARSWTPRTRLSHLIAALAVLAAALPAPAQELPPGLDVVPADAVGFVSVDVRAVLNGPLVEDFRFALDGLKPGEYAELARKFALDPATLERVVVIAPTAESIHNPTAPGKQPGHVSALAAFTFAKPFDPAEVQKSFFKEGRPKTHAGRTYQFDEKAQTGVLTLPGDRTLVVGSEGALTWLIDRLGKKAADGPLAAARGEAAKHLAYLAVVPSAAVPPGADLPPNLRTLAAARRAVVALDAGKTVSVAVRLDYADDKQAGDAEAAIKDLVKMGRAAVQAQIEELRQKVEKPGPAGRKLDLDEFPDRFAALLGVGALRQVDRELEALPVERRGTSVRVARENLTLPASFGPVTVIAAITALGSNTTATFEKVEPAVKPADPPPKPKKPATGG
jgi:hypothetical protein